MTVVLSAGRTSEGLAYWTSGRKHRRWLAVTHGSFGSHLDFCEVLAPFAESYNLLFWDMPGHGASRSVRPLRRLTEAARALSRVMEAADCPQAHQLGFSFGGMIAQSFARRFPSRCSSLIAYACVPITVMALPWPWAANAFLQMKFAATPWPQFCEEFSSKVSVREDLQKAFSRSLNKQNPAVRNAIYEAMVYGSTNEPNFRYEIPVAQIKGSLDDRFPGARAAMQALSDRLPAELVEEVTGAGHLAHLEQPVAFQNGLWRLLRRLDRD